MAKTVGRAGVNFDKLYKPNAHYMPLASFTTDVE